MKKILFVTLIVSVLVLPASAQRISRVNAGMDIGAGFAESQWGLSFLYFQALNLPKVPWVQINGGLRVWSYFANDVDLSAPSGASQRDFMQLSRVTVTGTSIVLGANFRIAKRVDLGVNTDVIGFALGKRRNAIYQLGSIAAADDSIRKFDGTQFGIAPTNLNVVPSFIKQNNGQTEAFLRVWVTPQFGIKAGYIWGQVAYRSDNKLNNGQRRFSSAYQMPYVALSLPLYN